MSFQDAYLQHVPRPWQWRVSPALGLEPPLIWKTLKIVLQGEPDERKVWSLISKFQQ